MGAMSRVKVTGICAPARAAVTTAMARQTRMRELDMNPAILPSGQQANSRQSTADDQITKWPIDQMGISPGCGITLTLSEGCLNDVAIGSLPGQPGFSCSDALADCGQRPG